MKKISYILLSFAALLLTASCTNEVDDLFEKSSAQRIQEASTTDQQILESASNGWVAHYYADTRYGGYNLYLKFKDDQVTIGNELFGDSLQTSHYKFEQSDGVILSMDEFNNLIHIFSEPSSKRNGGVGKSGEGYLGDFEFRVQQCSADSVILQGKKHGSKIVLTPLAKDETWAGYINKVAQVETVMNYKKYQLVLGEDTLACAKSQYRNLAVTYESDGTTKTLDVPYIITPNGIELYENNTINNYSLDGFNYAKGTEWSEKKGKSNIKLIAVLPSLADQIADGTFYLTYDAIGSFGKKYFNVAIKNAGDLAESLDYVIFGNFATSSYGEGFGLSFYSGSAEDGYYYGMYTMNCTIKSEDEVVLSFTGQGLGNASWYSKNANYDYMVFPLGYVNLPRTFKLTADDTRNPSYILMTDESNPENTFKLVPDGKEVLFK